MARPRSLSASIYGVSPGAFLAAAVVYRQGKVGPDAHPPGGTALSVALLVPLRNTGNPSLRHLRGVYQIRWYNKDRHFWGQIWIYKWDEWKKQEHLNLRLPQKVGFGLIFGEYAPFQF